MAAQESNKKSSARSASGKKDKTLKLKLVKSVIGSNQRQREVVRGLGLRRLNHTVERKDTPALRGMILKVAHLVEVVEG